MPIKREIDHQKTEIKPKHHRKHDIKDEKDFKRSKRKTKHLEDDDKTDIAAHD